MADEFQVSGKNTAARFTLTLYRGDGMTLLAMNWKKGKLTTRVYLGSYNFSATADTKNGENLLLIRNRRIAVSYMVEALRMLDHYHFRVSQQEAKTTKDKLVLARPPRKAGEKPWWDEHYTDAIKVRDRELFA